MTRPTTTIPSYTTTQFVQAFGREALDLAYALGDLHAWSAAMTEYGRKNEDVYCGVCEAEDILEKTLQKLHLEQGILLDGMFVDFWKPEHFVLGHTLEMAWHQASRE